MQGQTLADLIEAARYQGGKPLSYESLSKNCGGKPSAQRLQQYVTSDLKNFPDPDTIHGLRRGTGQSVQSIIHAAARSLGLIVADNDPDSLVVAGVSKLSPSSVESLRTIARELVTLTSEVHNANQDKPQANPPGYRTLRAVGSSRDAVQEQKIPHPDDPGFETPPPIEQLAALPYAKTHREKFDETYGERGEENQDPSEG